MKLLEALLERDLAPDERVARGLILSGRVLVDDRPVTSEHAELGEGVALRIKGEVEPDVSRGAKKLGPAIERTKFVVQDKVCLDLGVSTGGFSQVLLERGARRIYAVDVGYGITADSVRNDPRVVMLERSNARELSRAQVPEPVERVVGDLSFISWSVVLPAIVPLLAEDAELLLLVKPQFELREEWRSKALHNGVITDSRYLNWVLFDLYDVWTACGFRVRRIILSELPGAKGNREFFVQLQFGKMSQFREAYDQMARRAVREVLP